MVARTVLLLALLIPPALCSPAAAATLYALGRRRDGRFGTRVIVRRA